MPFRNIDATVFAEAPPDIEFHDGLFFITYRVGTTNTFRLCMVPNIFFKTTEVWRRAGDQFERHGTASVLPFAKAGETSGH